MRISLRVQFLAPLLGLVFLEAVGTLVAANRVAASTEREADQRLRRAARCFVEPPTFPVTERVLTQLKQASGADFVAVRPNAPMLSTFGDSVDLRRFQANESATVSVDGRDYATIAVKLSEPSAGTTLFLLDPVERREAAIRDAVLPVLALGVTAAFVTILVAAILGGWMVRRVRRVEAAARLVAGGDFSPIPLPEPNDELRDLTRGLNDMAAKLNAYRVEQVATERLRILGQFAGGLAHQLRNAAAGARLAVQLHQSQTESENPDALATALRQLRRMETLLQQFLGVGKGPSLRRQPCDPAMLVTEVVDLLGPQAKHQRTELIAVVSRTDSRELDPELFRHVVQNLCQNALEAAGSGGKVVVELCERPLGLVLIVSDTGPGPPEELAETLFEPFTTGKPEGVGLGLSIVRQAVSAHGGTVTWRRDAGRTVFQADLPASVCDRIT